MKWPNNTFTTVLALQSNLSPKLHWELSTLIIVEDPRDSTHSDALIPASKTWFPKPQIP